MYLLEGGGAGTMESLPPSLKPNPLVSKQIYDLAARAEMSWTKGAVKRFGIPTVGAVPNAYREAAVFFGRGKKEVKYTPAGNTLQQGSESNTGAREIFRGGGGGGGGGGGERRPPELEVEEDEDFWN